MKKFNSKQKYVFLTLEEGIITSHGRAIRSFERTGDNSPYYKFVPGVLEGIRQAILDGYKLVITSSQPDINTGEIKPSTMKRLLEDVIYNIGVFVANQTDYSSDYAFTTDQILAQVFIADSLESKNCKPEVPAIAKWLEEKKINIKDCVVVGNTSEDGAYADTLGIAYYPLNTFTTETPDLDTWIKED